jgi:hypothetical protein
VSERRSTATRGNWNVIEDPWRWSRLLNCSWGSIETDIGMDDAKRDRSGDNVREDWVVSVID